MNAQALLDNLTGRGFTLTVSGGVLFVSPRAALTPADADAIRAGKPELLELLGAVFARPYLDEVGDLRIPFDAHPRYHHWAGGQPIVSTLAELNAPVEIWRRYAAPGLRRLKSEHAAACKGQVERVGAVGYCAECKRFTEAA